MRLDEIKYNERNPRFISREKLDKLKKSITEFTRMLELRPMIVDETNTVLGGNQRLAALTELGYTEIPDEWVKKYTDLTADEKRAFVIKDNIAYGEWDWEITLADWSKDELEAWGLDIPEFAEAIPEAAEDNFIIPDEIYTDIQRGDIFTIGEHRIMCGDSTNAEDVETLAGGEIFDMVLTDPPYNVDYTGKTKDALKIQNDKMSAVTFYNFLLDFFRTFSNNTKEGGAFYIWHADSEGLNFRSAYTDAGLLMKQCLIWVKNTMVLGRQDYQWKHEPCLYGWKPGAAHYFTEDRTKVTVYDDQIDIDKLKKDEAIAMLKELMSDKTKTTIIYHDKPSRSAQHPTMKPVTLLAEQIKNSSRPGQIIADGFIGSGSTLVAAHQLRRRCFGMEIDPKYVQVVLDRITALEPEISMTKNGEPYKHETNEKQEAKQTKSKTKTRTK